jgi:hypothetical protein
LEVFESSGNQHQIAGLGNEPMRVSLLTFPSDMIDVPDKAEQKGSGMVAVQMPDFIDYSLM